MSEKKIENLTEKQKKQLLKLFKKTLTAFRGTILEHCVQIDQVCTSIISSYFVKHHYDQIFFSQIVLNDNEVTFSQRINIVEKLLKHRFQEFEKKHPELIKKMNRIRKLRNRLVHTLSSLDDINSIKSIMKSQVLLEYYEDGKIKHHSVSAKEMDIATKEYFSIMDELFTLFDLIEPKKPKS